MIEEAARRRAFQDFATTELNKSAAIGQVSKTLKRMEDSVQDTCPGQAVNGDHGQLAVEDRTKAEAFVRTYALVSKHHRLRQRDRMVKAELREAKKRPCDCDGYKTESCQPFTRQELVDQLRKLKAKKAPGPDDICAEQLQHLGQSAQDAVLALVNKSWLTAEAPPPGEGQTSSPS